MGKTAHGQDKGSKGGFLKAVGAIAAVVSLLLGLNQFTGVVQQFRIHHKEFSEAMKSGDAEQLRGDYGAAFHSFKRAAELDPIDRQAQSQETHAAMLWLENVHGTESQSFTQVADELLPVFDRALSKAKGQAAGDLMAHIAWANFLKYREGVREGVDVDGNLKLAFAADPNNVYAHSMAGLWILWHGGDIQAAESHFNAALATGRVKDYVRDLQLSALENSDEVENDIEQLRVADQMRKSGEAMPISHGHRVFWNVFTSHLHSQEELVKVLAGLPPADLEATYDWLDDTEKSQGKTWTRAFVMANLKEVSGDKAGALAAHQALQKEMMGSNSGLLPTVAWEIKRLTHAH